FKRLPIRRICGKDGLITGNCFLALTDRLVCPAEFEPNRMGRGIQIQFPQIFWDCEVWSIHVAVDDTSTERDVYLAWIDLFGSVQQSERVPEVPLPNAYSGEVNVERSKLHIFPDEGRQQLFSAVDVVL